jgi:hypothetical protein
MKLCPRCQMSARGRGRRATNHLARVRIHLIGDIEERADTEIRWSRDAEQKLIGTASVRLTERSVAFGSGGDLRWVGVFLRSPPRSSRQSPVTAVPNEELAN